MIMLSPSSKPYMMFVTSLCLIFCFIQNVKAEEKELSSHSHKHHIHKLPHKDKKGPPPHKKPTPHPPANEPKKGSASGRPLPRFASFKSDKVYLRRGPGERYPIDWVYYRRDLPVKIEREFDVWRLIEDPYGQKGWVHQITLHGKRTFVVCGKISDAKNNSSDNNKKDDVRYSGPIIEGYAKPYEINSLTAQGDVLLMSSPEATAKPIAILKPGAIGRLLACSAKSSWCHVSIKGYDGWIRRQLFLGAQPDEAIQPS